MDDFQPSRRNFGNVALGEMGGEGGRRKEEGEMVGNAMARRRRFSRFLASGINGEASTDLG